jgi:hypothetical protein
MSKRTAWALYATLAAITSVGSYACTLLEAKAPHLVERARVFDCRVEALRPVVGDVLDAEQLVRDVYLGKADLFAALRALKVTAAEAQALSVALEACNPPQPIPSGTST